MATMLDMLFMFCFGVGGAIMVIQFGLMLIGMGDDFDGDIDGDFDVDADTDLQADGDHHSTLTEAADADFDHPDSHWAFQVISIKGLIAATAFFGLGGLWARANDMGEAPSVAVATGLGLAAMYGVYWLMKQLYKLRSNGTANIKNARGHQATIYIPVPAEGVGRGKIQMTLQGRTMEYEAVTDEAQGLATGESVVVTAVLGNELVRVARVNEKATASV